MFCRFLFSAMQEPCFMFCRNHSLCFADSGVGELLETRRSSVVERACSTRNFWVHMRLRGHLWVYDCSV